MEPPCPTCLIDGLRVKLIEAKRARILKRPNSGPSPDQSADYAEETHRLDCTVAAKQESKKQCMGLNFIVEDKVQKAKQECKTQKISMTSKRKQPMSELPELKIASVLLAYRHLCKKV